MSTSSLRKLLVIDDDADTRAGLRYVLDHEYAVMDAASGEEGITLAKKGAYSVIVLDLEMQGMSGIETLQHLNQLNPVPQVIILTGRGSYEAAMSAVNLNAFRYLLKPVGIDLLRAVKDAFERFDHEQNADAYRQDSLQELKALGLSEREVEIASRVRRGDTNVQIAKALTISRRTVEKHLEKIYVKLGIKNRTRLAGRIRE